VKLLTINIDLTILVEIHSTLNRMEIAMVAATLVKKTASKSTADSIIGQSPAIASLKNMIERVGRSNASVMITGSSGSGKELVARAIHDASACSNGPFVAINCGAIPADLIESELFGHERGAFTGASARRIGRFEEANGGTIFLDEIGDMRFDMQVKLLRVLEDGIVTRVGSSSSTPVKVRVISATHQNIGMAIHENRFREDLFFRLSVVPVSVPSLASRTTDIPVLISHFQKKAGAPGAVRFSREAIVRLMQHEWPGNVRELRNMVERASVLHAGETLGIREIEQLLGFSFPTTFTTVEKAPIFAQPTASFDHPQSEPERRNMDSDRIPINLKELLETMELERIQMALDLADGVISEAARMLMLKRTTLIEKMRKYGVDKQC
jgi:sigma-54 dependent transcriptional regulator, flagellar regulatory protein